MTKAKILETLSSQLEVSASTESYHDQNYHYYKGRTDALKEVLRLLKSEAEGE